MNIGILTSGKLGYLVTRDLLKVFRPAFIATDRNSEAIIEIARKKRIPILIGNPRESVLSDFLKDLELKSDLVFSINYLFLLDEPSLGSLPLTINLHGSLLPKYRGRTPHVWAIINNEKETGITAHIIDANCDTGDIVKQHKVDIHIDDTGGDILNKFDSLYPSIVKDIIDEYKDGVIESYPQDNRKATYFGKRIPEDGTINWDWQKERIYNWIRAQANPYPGAFTFIGQNKVVIDKIQFSEVGFSNEDQNGLVLVDGKQPIIKCSNGAIELLSIRNKEVVKKIRKGMVLKYEN